MVRKKFVTSKSTTKTVTYGVYDPKAGEEAQRAEKSVHVRPTQRSVPVENKPSGGILGGILSPRKKKSNPTGKAEAFVESLDKD